MQWQARLVAILAGVLGVATVAMAGDPEIGECVHWANAFYPESIADQATVIGGKGERLYLHPRNPELCTKANMDECAGHSYVIPGDRLFVGNICGKWAFAWFPIKNRPRAYGWVKRTGIEIIRDDTQDFAKKITRRKLMSGLLLAPTSDTFLLAVRNNNLKQINSMLASGSANRLNVECDAIAYEALYSDIKTLRLLVKAGLDPNCSRSYRPAPLYRLASVDRGIASPWIDELPDPAGAAKNWIEVGAKPDAKNNGDSPLRLAIQRNNTDIAKVLLMAGADPNNYQKEPSTGRSSALTEAINYYSQTHDITMIKLLLEHGANVNLNNTSQPHGTIFDECPNRTTGVCEFSGQTVLTGAVEDGYYSIVKLLLDFGANPKLARSDGNTPLDIAIKKKNRRMTELLRNTLKASK